MGPVSNSGSTPNLAAQVKGLGGSKEAGQVTTPTATKGEVGSASTLAQAQSEGKPGVGVDSGNPLLETPSEQMGAALEEALAETSSKDENQKTTKEDKAEAEAKAAKLALKSNTAKGSNTESGSDQGGDNSEGKADGARTAAARNAGAAGADGAKTAAARTAGAEDIEVTEQYLTAAMAGKSGELTPPSNAQLMSWFMSSASSDLSIIFRELAKQLGANSFLEGLQAAEMGEMQLGSLEDIAKAIIKSANIQSKQKMEEASQTLTSGITQFVGASLSLAFSGALARASSKSKHPRPEPKLIDNQDGDMPDIPGRPGVKDTKFKGRQEAIRKRNQAIAHNDKRDANIAQKQYKLDLLQKQSGKLKNEAGNKQRIKEAKADLKAAKAEKRENQDITDEMLTDHELQTYNSEIRTASRETKQVMSSLITASTGLISGMLNSASQVRQSELIAEGGQVDAEKSKLEGMLQHFTTAMLNLHQKNVDEMDQNHSAILRMITESLKPKSYNG